MLYQLRIAVLSAALIATILSLTTSCSKDDNPTEPNEQCGGGGVCQEVSESGGVVSHPDAGSVEIPEGAFQSTEQVEFFISSDPAIADLFAETSQLFQPGERTSFEARISVSAIPDAETVQVILTIPDSLPVPSDYDVEVFALIHQETEEEVLDVFELLPALRAADRSTIQLDLPTSAFSQVTAAEGAFEAVLVLSTTPGINSNSFLLLDDGECLAGAISCPLDRGCEVTSPFSPARVHPVHGGVSPHFGVDFRAPVGSRVISASDGVIERSYLSSSYGHTIIVRHDNGSATLYAHLSQRDVAVGVDVHEGQLIGLSGNTGTSSGPHLHFEYVPNGRIIQSKHRIDPFPCIGAHFDGSITVGDNGSLADDAFEVFLDGVRLGQTDIGAINTITVSNLRPGQHELTIKVILAPDDVGTWQIILNDGLTFAGGGSSREGRHPEGTVLNFSIVVPAGGAAGLNDDSAPWRKQAE